MGVLSASFGCRGVVGFNCCCSGASSGVRGFKFLVIAACRGGTCFICPLPELWGGAACSPTGVPGAGGPGRPRALQTLLLGSRTLHHCQVDARADRRCDDRREDPAKLVRLERAPHENGIDVLGVNADVRQGRRS